MYLSARLQPKRYLIAIIAISCLLISIPLFALARAPKTQKTVYLTFDDGPSYVTQRLLETLKKHNVKATFFVTGQYEDHLPTLKQIVDDGHLIALHTYTHKFSEIYSSTDAFWADIERLDTVIFDQTGQHAAKMIRFPGGSSNVVSYRYGGAELMDRLVEQCAEKGYSYYDWTIDTKDAVSGSKSASYITEKVMTNIDNVPVAVVLMHDGPQQKTAADAADQIITQLKTQGYVFDTLDNLTAQVHHNMP